MMQNHFFVFIFFQFFKRSDNKREMSVYVKKLEDLLLEKNGRKKLSLGGSHDLGNQKQKNTIDPVVT
jgi:hypothetical protein